MTSLLDHLCERCGVLPVYRDIWNRAFHTPDNVKRALLAAMDVAADTDEDILQSLQAFEAREWGRVLPPVQVVRAESLPYRIPLSLPLDEASRDFRWRLIKESGGEEAGTFSSDACEEDGRNTLDDKAYVRRILKLEQPVETGYHRLLIERADGKGPHAVMAFIVTPSTCYQPPAIQGEGRVWGFAVQLYGVRSERNWGMGDLGDLRRLVEYCADVGASTVLLNPLHALFPDAPDHASPYSPSSRAYFNILYLDVEGVPDFAECAEAREMVHDPRFQAQLRALRASGQVDYRGVAEAKSRVLGRLYEHFRATHLEHDSERARAFRRFQNEHGESLRMQAQFEVLQAHFRSQDNDVWGWPAWPEGYRYPHSEDVTAFCNAHLEQIEYHEYLQWQVSRQLAQAGTRSWEMGLGIGVMLDLAIGVAEGGAATWMRRDLYALKASAGAPPDDFNRLGQDWGLPPWIPYRLKEHAYLPFIELLRANMRDSGALRLDHVMGLYRLFWVARGHPIAAGAYVRYPFEDLLGILALESQRNRCLVVGEDLGTVPDEVREALHPMDVLSTRLLYLERQEDGRLSPPRDYPAQAAAAVTTHDLPTLAGYWQGLDIDLRDRLHLFPDTEVRDQQVVTRSEDRAHLLIALSGEGVLPPDKGVQPVAFPEMTAELAAAVYRYLARAPSKVMLLQMEDGLGVHEQPNLPGTVDPTYPCWRLKMPLNLDEWGDSPYLGGILQALRQERPVTHAPGPARGLRQDGVHLWIPRATYRLQLHRDFTLNQATGLLAYLDALGISHCYLSPLLKARPGSRHGYDITDHSSLNPEIASAEDFEQFVAALKRLGMGQIMDMVPNHMGIMGADNAWWLDVLENGPASRFAGYFDIDWYPLADGMPGRVLLPVLGDHYGAVLEAGELRLAFDAEQGAFSVYYYEHRFPVDPRTYPHILSHQLDTLQARMGAEHPQLLEFQTLVTAFSYLPGRDGADPPSVAERARDKEVHKHHLASLYVSSADIARFMQENVAAFNGDPSGTGRFDLMHDLLEAQAYRLAFWRVAADEINYRRFFDINDLAALRMDNPEVFEATHRLVRELLSRGYVNGLRIDHPDGLYAPGEYFDRLQAMAGALARVEDEEATAARSHPLYLVVEKILAVHEHLPDRWAVHGTTGYDFAAACSGLFVDHQAEARFTRIYQDFIGEQPDYDALVRANKHLIMETSLAGELQVLATQLTRIAKGDRRTCDFTLNTLRGALADIVSCFPVYRTYVNDGEATPDDARYVDWAVGLARKQSLAADTSIYDFVREVLLARHGQGRADEYRQAVSALAMKFQQFSSPVMAKSVEDTSFYQYHRLASLNEVGSEPDRFGVSVAAFHHANQARSQRWPHAMLASSTHDNKRSEDVRARISTLSEMPDAWEQALQRWDTLNRSKRRQIDDQWAPSRNDEYLLYQTLLGVWTFEAPDATGLDQLSGRIEAYMVKAAREAKQHTSWINPNAPYEAALQDFVRGLLTPDATNLFMRDFRPLQQRVARAGAFSSLSQVLLKLTSPGVPDIYQGNELWDFSLVDPDNRRPVDYAIRMQHLAALQAQCDERGAARCACDLLDELESGRIKLYLIWKTLAFRRQAEALFGQGDYLPLKVQGDRAGHVCAFARHFGGRSVLVVVPRLFDGLMGEQGTLPVGEAVWGHTRVELPPDRSCAQWTNILTEASHAVHVTENAPQLLLEELFRVFPYAVLRPQAEQAWAGS